MADIRDLYGTDEALEVEGQWVNYGSFKLKIARMGNRRYNEHWARLVKPYRAQIQENTLEEPIMIELMVDTMAATILVDWDEVELDGEKLDYSIDNAKRILMIRDFRKLVFDTSGMAETYRQEDQKEAEKNSKRPSSGKPSGGPKSSSSEAD